MAKWRKRPVVIDAIQWTGENYEEIYNFESPKGMAKIGLRGDKLSIFTLEGIHTANVGDWVIKGIKGEFYPCKPDIFKATYEIADPVSSHKEYHTMLHKYFDQLFAAWIQETKGLPSDCTIMQLMDWSYKQTLPTEAQNVE